MTAGFLTGIVGGASFLWALGPGDFGGTTLLFMAVGAAMGAVVGTYTGMGLGWLIAKKKGAPGDMTGRQRA